MPIDVEKIQQRINEIKIPFIRSLHSFEGIEETFKPWKLNLSPSALYNCSVACKKAMKLKTPEVKWVSIKRWVTVTPTGIVLPEGCYLSIKRREHFVASPSPRLEKQDFILIMLPYGNVWSQIEPDRPITEDWLWSELDGKLVFERLIDKDAVNPLKGYFAACKDYFEKNPDQIGIHLKRKKSIESTTEK
jgi:hypothetical protein